MREAQKTAVGQYNISTSLAHSESRYVGIYAADLVSPIWFKRCHCQGRGPVSNCVACRLFTGPSMFLVPEPSLFLS